MRQILYLHFRDKEAEVWKTYSILPHYEVGTLILCWKYIYHTALRSLGFLESPLSSSLASLLILVREMVWQENLARTSGMRRKILGSKGNEGTLVTVNKWYVKGIRKRRIKILVKRKSGGSVLHLPFSAVLFLVGNGAHHSPRSTLCTGQKGKYKQC